MSLPIGSKMLMHMMLKRGYITAYRERVEWAAYEVQIIGDEWHLIPDTVMFAGPKYLVDWISEIAADALMLEMGFTPEQFTSDARIKKINQELDILRGVVPTPPGYSADPDRARELMTELRKLVAK